MKSDQAGRTSDAAQRQSAATSPSHLDTAIGREIRKLRRARGVTLKQLAEMVGVTGAQMHRYELALTRISAHRLHGIADALSEPVEALLGKAQLPRVQPEKSLAGLQHESLELVELFNTIEDEGCRDAILSIVRSLANSAGHAHYGVRGADEAGLPVQATP